MLMVLYIRVGGRGFRRREKRKESGGFSTEACCIGLEVPMMGIADTTII